MALGSAVSTLPLFARVYQTVDTGSVADVAAAVAQGFAAQAAGRIAPGMRVAITVGSRGLAAYAELVAAVVAEVRQRGALPFLVAAMGSHGGATPAGQRAVLEGYGISEARLGCPIDCSMETVELGQTAAGVPVHLARAAVEADALVLLNRVKPHSILTGELGSGLIKMLAVGLGKHLGAATIHRHGLAAHLLPVARLALARAPVCLGVALVENGRGQPWKISVVPAEAIEATDRQLLREARSLLPGIPFEPLDVLIVDRIGKNISGVGMDTNVIGMHRRLGGPAERVIERIVALELTAESHGNAIGVGMADIITQALRDRIDLAATYANAITSGFLAGAKLPLVCPSARAAVELACAPYAPERLRAVRVADTAHLEELWVSMALLPELAQRPQLVLVEQPRPLELAE